MKQNDNLNENNKFEALTPGVEEGGLRSTVEIVMLICYLVVYSKSKLNPQIITDALTQGGIANYFEVANGIQELIKRKTIIQDEDGFLSAGEGCKKMVNTIEDDLPFSVKKRSLKLIAELSADNDNKKDCDISIIKADDSLFDITMSIEDKGKNIMSLTLNAQSPDQCDIIKKSFYKNHKKIYLNVINSLFSDEN